MNAEGLTNALVIMIVVVAVLFIGLSIHLMLRMTKLEKRYKRFMKGADGISLEKHFTNEFERLDELRDEQRDEKAALAAVSQEQRKNFTKYGIVKYDAFEDIGGKLSFVLALLNEDNTGIVLNAIHSKDNCFLYLKEIVKGESYIMLSKEEIKALNIARNKVDIDDIEIMSTERADSNEGNEERGQNID